MIKGLFRLITLMLVLGGWSLAALSLHVIRVPGDMPIKLVTKDRLELADTYVDTTKWTLDDVAAHPALVEKLIRIGKADTLQHVVGPGDAAPQLTYALAHASSTSQPAKPAPALSKPVPTTNKISGTVARFFH